MTGTAHGTEPDTLSAMVLAAGYGTRMGALTQTCPKPLLGVAGRSLLDRTLDRVEAAGIGRAVVNTHYLGAQIREHLAQRPSPILALSEEPELLDTGGGVARARPLLGGPVAVVMNSDAVFAGANPLAPLLAAGLPDGTDAHLLMVPRAQTRGYTRAGDFFPAGPGLRRRGEAPSAPLVFTGVQLLRLSALDGMPAGAFSLNPVWDRLIAAERLVHSTYPGLWVDVGTPAGLVAAERALEEIRA
ncbi:MAG: nucleotidyltransferase family protein [Pseudomonadota bacterium]